MKTLARLGILSLVLPAVSAMAHDAPAVLEHQGKSRQGAPLWVSAKTVADAEKVVNLDLIGSAALRNYLEGQRQALGQRIPAESSTAGEKPAVAMISQSECKSDILFAETRGGHNPSASLADLATYSQSIVRGVIGSLDPGFAFGEPVVLVGVEPKEVLKGGASSSPFYVAYPVARFRIGMFHFCNGEKGYEPRLGDEILLFDYLGPRDRAGILFAPRLEQIFFQSQSDLLFLPSRLKDKPDLKGVRTLDEITSRLRTGSYFSPGDGR